MSSVFLEQLLVEVKSVDLTQRPGLKYRLCLCPSWVSVGELFHVLKLQFLHPLSGLAHTCVLGCLYRLSEKRWQQVEQCATVTRMEAVPVIILLRAWERVTDWFW